MRFDEGSASQISALDLLEIYKATVKLQALVKEGQHENNFEKFFVSAGLFHPTDPRGHIYPATC